jgi:hypothetical protein
MTTAPTQNRKKPIFPAKYKNRYYVLLPEF